MKDCEQGNRTNIKKYRIFQVIYLKIQFQNKINSDNKNLFPTVDHFHGLYKRTIKILSNIASNGIVENIKPSPTTI